MIAEFLASAAQTYVITYCVGRDLQWWSRPKKSIDDLGKMTDEELRQKQKIEEQMIDEKL